METGTRNFLAALSLGRSFYLACVLLFFERSLMPRLFSSVLINGTFQEILALLDGARQ